MMKAPVEVQFAQKLAANDKLTRDKALRKLKKWFHTRSSVSTPFQDDEQLRLWKGLFYCYWMSDKPLVQEELAINIASCIDAFCTEDSALGFIKAFFLTMGREWFGIDKWRMDKFMMMSRRFLRQVFKYNAKKGWDEELSSKIRDIISETLILVDINSTSLGFQMHITDIFLEELAKVGGEKLDQSVLNIYLQPFLKIVSEGREPRLRDHVVERIFNHILRQSDPGIEWEMEKEVESLGNIELIQGEDEEEVDIDEEDVDLDEEVSSKPKAEDPRAGRVDVEIPQLKINYKEISEQMFELGSQNSIMKSNRTLLYRLSKMFKDVESGVFPLGDDISDEEPDEKINVKASVEKLLKKQEKLKKKNLKGKEEYRKWKKEQEAAQEAEEDEDEDVFSNVYEEKEEEEAEDLKRKLEEEPEETPEAKKARIHESKMNKKEKEKKRKAELKRQKRERLLAEKIKEGEERRKADIMIEQDIGLIKAMEPENLDSVLEKKQKKLKKKQESLKEKSEVMANGNSPSTKKSKKELVKESPAKTKEQITLTNGDTTHSPEKKKKKKKKNKNKDTSVLDTDASLIEDSSILKESEDLSDMSQSQKKKKKNKSETPALNDTTELSQSSKKKKKLKNEDSPAKFSDPAPTKIEDVSSVKNKKKKKDGNESITNGKLFEVPSDWDTPLQPGEQEIVMPNKKYKGTAKLSPVSPVSPVSSGFPEFDSPTVSTPNLAKSHTAVFLKKAMSKSATPKKKLKRLGEEQSKSASSEPRLKRVNFALTRNMSQEIEDLYTSIASSPGTPHDPKKNPEKSLLKRTLSKPASTLHPVSLNTQLNSLSPMGKKALIGKKRMKAKDFFS